MSRRVPLLEHDTAASMHLPVEHDVALETTSIARNGCRSIQQLLLRATCYMELEPHLMVHTFWPSALTPLPQPQPLKQSEAVELS